MNIYIGNLNYRVKEADLQQVIEEYGAVESVKIIKDRETGKSKGFAFIEMNNDAQAKQAIEELNGSEFVQDLKKTSFTCESLVYASLSFLYRRLTITAYKKRPDFT